MRRFTAVAAVRAAFSFMGLLRRRAAITVGRSLCLNLAVARDVPAVPMVVSPERCTQEAEARVQSCEKA